MELNHPFMNTTTLKTSQKISLKISLNLTSITLIFALAEDSIKSLQAHIQTRTGSRSAGG